MNNLSILIVANSVNKARQKINYFELEHFALNCLVQYYVTLFASIDQQAKIQH